MTDQSLWGGDLPPAAPAEETNGQVKERRWGAGSVALVVLLTLATQFALAAAIIVYAISTVPSETLAGPDGVDILLDEATDLLLSGPGLLSALAVQWLAFIGGPWLVSRFRGLRSMGRDFGLVFRRQDVYYGVALALALQVLQFVVLNVADFSDSDNTNIVTDNSGIFLAAMIVGACLITPFAEELFFRGMLLRAILRTKVGGWWPAGPNGEPTGPTSRGIAILGVVVTSVIFGSLHMTTDGSLVNSLPLMALTGLIGAALGTAAVVTQRLGTPIIAHIAFNTISVVGALLTG